MSRNQSDSQDLCIKRVAFEIKYEKGYRFIDRTGEALIEIEERLPGWIPQEISPTGGLIDKPGSKMNATFDGYRIAITQEDLSNPKEIAVDGEKLISILLEKFQIQKLLRIGCRTFLHQPYDSTQEASEALIDSKLVQPSQRIFDLFSGELQSGEATYVFEKEKESWRIRLCVIQQISSPAIDKRLLIDPKNLSEKQKEARKQLLKLSLERKFSYSSAIEIDIDRGIASPPEPKELNIAEWILESIKLSSEKAFKLIRAE